MILVTEYMVGGDLWHVLRHDTEHNFSWYKRSPPPIAPDPPHVRLKTRFQLVEEVTPHPFRSPLAPSPCTLPWAWEFLNPSPCPTQTLGMATCQNCMVYLVRGSSIAGRIHYVHPTGLVEM